MTNTTNTITQGDIECADILLTSGCDALSAIANAIEILSAIKPAPKGLLNSTISRLAAHAAYLADSLKDNVGCFIEKVPAQQTEADKT